MQTTTPPSTPQHSVRIYYEDTDAGGIVYYANYLKYFERARTEWLRDLGINQSELAQSKQQLFVVKATTMDYLKPAKLDDLLTIHSKITHIGGASVHFAQEAWHNGHKLCQGTVVVVCVDTTEMRATKIHPDLRTLLENAQD